MKRAVEALKLEMTARLGCNARERAVSSALLPLVALALTFASFDWLMSLQPLWASSIFGVYFFAGGFVASLGLLSALAFAAERTGAARTPAIPR